MSQHTTVAAAASSYSGEFEKPAASDHAEAAIGEDGKPIRALAFSGGLFDAAMQLGTVHALLVSCAKKPDVIVGISTGAINAVAAAEILKAGDGIADEAQAVEARVSKFRQVFEAYRQSPEDVLAPFLPDVYQIEAEAPLKPTNLPIFRKEERADRYRAAQSRVGLIKLTNDILRLDISVGSIARLVRVGLGLVAARELPSRTSRVVARTLEAVRLWRVLLGNLFALVPIGARLIRVASAPTAKRVADWLRKSTAIYTVLSIVPRLNPLTLTSGLASRLEGEQAVTSDRPIGVDAGHAMFRGFLRRGFAATFWWLLGFALVFTLVLVLPVMVIAIAAAIVVQWLWPFVAHTRLWQTGTGIIAAETHALARSFVARFAAHVYSPVQPTISYLWRVAAALSVSVGHAALDFHGWLDKRTALDAPIHALNPFNLSIGQNALWVGIVILGGMSARHLVSTDAVLRYYGILDGVLDPYPLQSWLVRLFDPAYFGESDLDDIVARAFGSKDGEAALDGTGPKTLAKYADADGPIHVGPMAADVRTGRLTVLPSSTPVVDALMAATAIPPFFQAQSIPRKHRPGQDESWYIDGSVVANEPTRALATHLTPRVNPRSTELLIYSASSLPLSATELGRETGKDEYSGLVDSSRRAVSLESFRDATLDRRMTDLVSRTIPAGGAAWTPPGSQSRFIRSSVHPIELDRAASLNKRLLTARGVADRRRMIAESVADGCRSSIQVLMHKSLLGAARKEDTQVSCRTLISMRVQGDHLLPGSKDAPGPGLPEVCQACVLRDAAGQITAPQFLAVPKTRRELPVWPTRWDDDRPAEVATRPHTAATEYVRTTDRDYVAPAGSWPVDRRDADGGVRPGDERATVSLLFSGGVFRGVYLAGVINALNEVGVRPDIIAGSSIGSITAAMAARLFSEPDPEERKARVVRVAATYLAVDRLVLTDRFSDFIRNFTLRAGATRFSIRDLDTTFRAFDREDTGRFARHARRVLAGLERLVYISPFEARDLARASRMRRYDDVMGLLSEYGQEWLERGGAGLELLGAEPLERLIRFHVLDGAAIDDVNEATKFTRDLGAAGIQFIATATNLSRGRLETLSVPPSPDSPDKHVRLVQALLASSAFPAVFRPRWTWEVIPETSDVEQFIDGGVMDNLPLDAVARFLNNARGANRLAVRPAGGRVPHLLFTASLEVQRQDLTPDATRFVAARWLEAYRRAKSLSYNNKIDSYAQTQRDLRTIWSSARASGRGAYQPLDLEVVAVKPNWLCGTFAFHPMLGFRRVKQAQSIAHGCKSTLEQLYALNAPNSDSARWVSGWGLQLKGTWLNERRNEPESAGACWYRSGCACPYSATELKKTAPDLHETTKREIARIHQLCRRRSTHARQEPNQLFRQPPSSPTPTASSPRQPNHS